MICANCLSLPLPSRNNFLLIQTMYIWPSKTVRDFFTVSHLDFIERNSRENLLPKQTSRTRSINGDNRELAGEGEGERASATPRGRGFWKEVFDFCCCLDLWFWWSDDE